MLQRLADAAPSFEPGTRAEYSNPGFALAGLGIDSVCGQPLAEVVQRDRFVGPGAATDSVCGAARPDRVRCTIGVERDALGP